MAHDLSFQKVELDLHELIKVAGQACKNAKSQMQHWQGVVDNTLLYNGNINRTDEHQIYRMNHKAQFYAQTMAESAQEYADAMKMYYALVECLHREEIVINKE
jgi:uncharacterized protein YutE (UPF0331/DUF86 family)